MPWSARASRLAAAPHQRLLEAVVVEPARALVPRLPLRADVVGVAEVADGRAALHRELAVALVEGGGVVGPEHELDAGAEVVGRPRVAPSHLLRQHVAGEETVLDAASVDPARRTEAVPAEAARAVVPGLVAVLDEDLAEGVGPGGCVHPAL